MTNIIRMYLGYNLLISQRSMPINASASTGSVTYQSFLCTVANQLNHRVISDLSHYKLLWCMASLGNN